MIKDESIRMVRSARGAPDRFGTLCLMAIFFWTIGMVMFAPAEKLLWAGGLCLLVAAVVYPSSFRHLMRPRWLLMIGLLAIPPVFFLGDLDRSVWGIPYSSEGLVGSGQIILRVIVMLVAVNGFSSSVDISSIAGLLERVGLRGLGFSMGVALNLLPSLQREAFNTWHSLWMRGGLRHQRWRGIKLLLMTIVTNALRRTEEIALAAEGRAFRPEQCRALSLRNGTLDSIMLPAILVITVCFFVLI